jgi:queuosine precursor transporter
MKFKYSIVYIMLIVFVNWLFTVVPLIDLPTGEKWPPASLIVGLIFVARDFAQREIGHRVIVAMLIAGVMSYYLADPFVAAASVTAFLISEFADWAIYSFTGKPFAQRVLLSSVIATPIDSAVFLYMLGHLGAMGVTLMTLSKLVGALIVWAMIRNRMDDALV